MNRSIELSMEDSILLNNLGGKKRHFDQNWPIHVKVRKQMVKIEIFRTCEVCGSVLSFWMRERVRLRLSVLKII